MDLNSLRDQVSNLTIYDLKAGVRKVQNGQMLPNFSETSDNNPLTADMFSCNELYGNGGQSARGYQQWTVGGEFKWERLLK